MAAAHQPIAKRAQRQVADHYIRLKEAFDRNDSLAYANLYAEDALLMVGGEPPLIGRAAIARHVKDAYFRHGVRSAEMSTDALVEAAGWIIHMGTYNMMFGDGHHDSGNYVTVFRSTGKGAVEPRIDIMDPQPAGGRTGEMP